MAKGKAKASGAANRSMAEIMVAQWRDERLKSATARDLVLAYGVSLDEGEAVLHRELKKRKWI
jgi:hypothetical protein